MLGDRIPEADEVFQLQLSNKVNSTVGARMATGKILNDDSFTPACASATVLTIPAGRTCFQRGSDIRLLIDTPASTELIHHVEFYAGTVPVGRAALAPFETV